MNIHFQIEYRVYNGEYLVLNFKGNRYMMETTDGNIWRCTQTADYDLGLIQYTYEVWRDGKLFRKEWELVPHTIAITLKGENYWQYDRWSTMPEDSYLYSSAFTACIFPKGSDPKAFERIHASVNQPSAVRIVVRAPQLLKNQHLALCGDDPQLGSWNVSQAIPMVQCSPNEWTTCIEESKLKRRYIEFKFLAINDDNNQSYVWEEGQNRCITLPEMKRGDVVSYELDQSFYCFENQRFAGTLVPVFSLRTKDSFGVGDFGDLKKMIDWVALTGQRVLQILPINDSTITHTWTDSYPYSCISICALHPQYADLNALPPIKDKKLKAKFSRLQKKLNALPQIDYEKVNNAKNEYLHIIFEQEGEAMLQSPAFKQFFSEEEHWLVPYAQYSTLRDKFGTANYTQWPDHNVWNEADRKRLSNPRTKEYKAVAYFYFLQFILQEQMKDAHNHARQNNVVLKGDIPIGVNRYGCDAWQEPRYFNLNGQAGAPPDDFAVDGQNWGFPTYNWDEMLKDDCQWWVRRFQNMQKYFDAYRIDHVLGFFRIWEIPMPEKSGLLGQFSPALPMTKEEIESYGMQFHEELFLKDHGHGQPSTNQRPSPNFPTNQRPVPGNSIVGSSAGSLWHPMISGHLTPFYQTLPDHEKQAYWNLRCDFFYRRHNQFWYDEAMKKLPKLINATRMLVCAEDLGMVPDCVAWVMQELKILSLELQSMPKDPNVRFGHLSRNPYRSVSTISSHDMPTLRMWWDEDETRTQNYYNTMLHRTGDAPHPLPADLAADIIARHYASPSMLCILSIQDLLAISDRLKLADANAERINIPANPQHYWRYRMHLNIEDILTDNEYNNRLRNLITASGR